MDGVERPGVANPAGCTSESDTIDDVSVVGVARRWRPDPEEVGFSSEKPKVPNTLLDELPLRGPCLEDDSEVRVEDRSEDAERIMSVSDA